MDMEGALRARLIADTTVAGDVGARVYWVDRPQGRPLPDITLQMISGSRDQHMAGFQSLQRERIQVDVRAADFATARRIREAVIAAITPRTTTNGIRFDRASIPNRQDSTEPLATGGIVHRHRIDFIISFSNA
jgi:hypothetical protein